MVWVPFKKCTDTSMGQEASLVESKSKVLELECEYIIEKQIFF